jgi:chemotaxis protein histidine kinase CheA
VGLGKYIKKAFLNYWNLLAFLGCMGFAIISGHPDVLVPLVMAGEATYLGVLGTHPKFQRYVDVQEHKAVREQGSVVVAEAFDRILKSLPPRQLRRFEASRDRCLSLRQIAQQMRASEDLTAGSAPEPLEDLQLSGLDRLLWIYLRLLYTQTMLERFFERTGEDQIQSEIKRLEERIARMPAEPAASPSRQGILKALQDNLETCRGRLANLQKARENFELVEAEIERLENKIRSITEMAINRQDPQFVSGQVDQVAASLVQTEQTMNELQFATGLDPIDDAAPSIIPRGAAIEPMPAAQDIAPPRPRNRQTEDGIHYN